ncbi:hypothetical protein [Alienimonas sp. DA493]|uniref:hypothetical protein n=1 Tax=Alienimonas sp. DA493 TaxID=3373605 RepID=UPI003754935B
MTAPNDRGLWCPAPPIVAAAPWRAARFRGRWCVLADCPDGVRLVRWCRDATQAAEVAAGHSAASPSLTRRSAASRSSLS